MKFDVVCFGSAVVDVFLKSKKFKTIHSKQLKTGVGLCQTMEGKIKVDKLAVSSGGGATNTAVSFERKGIQAASVVCLGADFWGRFIRKELKSAGVSLRHVQENKIYPTSYSTILVNQKGQRTVLVYRGASNQLSRRQIKWQSLNTNWFYVSSLGGDLALLTKIVRVAQDNNFKIALNPGSLEIKAKDKLKPFLKQVDLLLVNKVEAIDLIGKKSNHKSDLIADLRNMGPRMVALTEGSDGAWLAVGKKIYKSNPFKVKDIEHTGAGDAFGSGLVSGLILNFKPKKALKLAMANSASVVTKIGAKDGLLWKDEVRQWLKKPLEIKG